MELLELLDIHGVMKVIPAGRSTLQAKWAAGEFPPPDGQLWGKNVWRRETINRFIQDNFPGSLQPQQLPQVVLPD